MSNDAIPMDMSHWVNEVGFENFDSCRDYVRVKASQSIREIKYVEHKKSIDLYIINAVDPVAFQDQKTTVLVTNNCINKDVLDSKYYEQFPQSWYGMYAGNVAINHVVPTKDFNCFINRMDPIRQSWLYQLIRCGIFNQGYVSFHMDISRHILYKQCRQDALPLEVFDQQFQEQLNIFKSEHQFIRPQVPYCNFDSTVELNQLIMDSKFSIVLETVFHCNEVITFSEKIFRCLKLPRPWVLFAMQGAVQELRNMGFDVLDDIVDHSYDTIEFGIERQTKILNISQKLCKIQFTPGLIKRMEIAASKNQELLSTMLSSFHQDVDKTFERAVVKCLSLT
jgi:hypothetical protein